MSPDIMKLRCFLQEMLICLLRIVNTKFIVANSQQASRMFQTSFIVRIHLMTKVTRILRQRLKRSGTQAN